MVFGLCASLWIITSLSDLLCCLVLTVMPLHEYETSEVASFFLVASSGISRDPNLLIGGPSFSRSN